MIPFAGAARWLRREAFRISAARIICVALIALVALTYVPYINSPLVFDDINIINSGPLMDYIFRFWIGQRWISYATLAHTYLLTDGSIPAMRLGNLILHAANAVAVFVLVRGLCESVNYANGKTAAAEASPIATAAFASALFAVHPFAVYGAGYLVQRSILMSTLFMLLMLIFHLRWLMTGRNAFWLWAALWYFLSVWSKEHSVMAPVLALLLSPVVRRPSAADLSKLILPFCAYAIIAVLIITLVKGVVGTAYEPLAMAMMQEQRLLDDEGVRTSFGLSILTQAYLYFKYLLLWAIPNTHWMAIDMREPLAKTFLDWPYWVSGLAYPGVGFYALYLVTRGGTAGLVGWLLACPWLLFATELSTIRVQEPFVIYRAYLWFAVLGALPGLALSRLKPGVAALVAAPVMVLLVLLSWNRLQTMTDPLLLWDDAAKLLATGREPGAGRIYYNRALALSSVGRKDAALADLDRAVELNPRLAPIYYTRAKLKYDLGKSAEALQDLNRSIALDNKDSGVYMARAMVHRRLGNLDQAQQDLELSCKLQNPIACFALKQQQDHEQPRDGVHPHAGAQMNGR